MLIAAALVYSLLCLRICVRLEAAWNGAQGSASFSVGTLGVELRRDFVLIQGERCFSVRAQLRYGKPAAGKKRGAANGRMIRAYLLDALRSRRFERVSVHIRLGLGDAAETALAAGATHALISALLTAAGDPGICDLRIVPDFSGMRLCAHMSGIFSCRLGDMVFAIIKHARGKKSGGLKWTSIPLRA